MKLFDTKTVTRGNYFLEWPLKIIAWIFKSKSTITATFILSLIVCYLISHSIRNAILIVIGIIAFGTILWFLIKLFFRWSHRRTVIAIRHSGRDIKGFFLKNKNTHLLLFLVVYAVILMISDGVGEWETNPLFFLMIAALALVPSVLNQYLMPKKKKKSKA